MSKHKHLMTRDEYRERERQDETSTNNSTSTIDHAGQNSRPEQPATPNHDGNGGNTLFKIGAWIVGIIIAYYVLKVLFSWTMTLLGGIFSWLISAGEFLVIFFGIYWVLKALGGKADRSMDDTIDHYKHPERHGWRQK